MGNFTSPTEQLRSEIAAAAARLIAEDGADYGTAKRKAAKQILGNAKVRGDVMPDNAQIEDEVRSYNEIFFGDRQPARLLHLRQIALMLMEDLAVFSPHLVGAVLNGTAGEHSDIHLQLFTDSSKDVAIFLLNKGISFDVSETARSKGQGEPVETLSYIWKNEGVHLALYETNDLRGASKTAPDGRAIRADREALKVLIAETAEK